MSGSDDIFFKSLRNGQNDPLGEFYKSYRDEFVTWIMNHLGLNIDDAKDVFSDAIIILYEKVASGTLRHEDMSAKLKTYFFSVGRFTGLDKLKSRQRKQRILNEFARHVDQEDDPWLLEDQNEEFREKLSMVQNAMSELKDRCRQILRLFYYDRKSHTEIAEIMDYSNSDSAKRAKHSCMERLRKSVFALESNKLEK